MNTIAIIGEGKLADILCRRLSEFSAARKADIRKGIPDAKLVLVVLEYESPFLPSEVEEKLRTRGIPWLCVYVSQTEGVVGPLTYPGKQGCAQCAETRRSLAGSNRSEVTEMLMQLINPKAVTEMTEEISLAAINYMVRIISAEAVKVLQDDKATTEEHVYMINLSNLNSSVHFVLPDGTCPFCNQLPDDSPQLAVISLQACLKVNNSYRCRSIKDLREVLVKDYVDSRTGLLNVKQSDLYSVYAGVAVSLPLGIQNELAGGRSHSYADSELIAILEGLERYCSFTPRGKRTVVRDSFSRLHKDALDPSKTGFHAKEMFEQPDFPFTPFDPDAPMEWVWGYSFLQERPILVPRSLAYYSQEYGDGFAYEISNGCAIGGSLEEAILHGIFEVIERDSFLMTWYAQLPVPRLVTSSTGDQELSLMICRLEAVTGYQVYLYNTTMENGVPSIWALAKGGSEHQVNLICAAGAHLDPIRAAKSALHELAGMIPSAEQRWKDRREEAEAMYEDSFLVQEMEDHSLLYSLPKAEERLKFLMDERRPARTFDEEFHLLPLQEDLTEDLKQVIQVFRGLQMDVIVVDQTSIEAQRNGLRCVKVLIPGMLPMTFGHQFRRVTGLDRIFAVPKKLGYVDHKITLEQLNPYPHPFP